MKGSVVSIAIAPAAGEPARLVSDVRAIPGQGLEGDRYFNLSRTSGNPTEPGEQVTLIETENVEAFNREYGASYTPAEMRRNIATRGIALNDLEGREFTIGEVRARGIELCEPCKYLAEITTGDVLRGLVHKAGLRAEILSEGTIRVGDAVEPVENDAVGAASADAASTGV